VLLAIALLELLGMVVEDRFRRKTPVTHLKLLHKLELEFGVVLLTENFRDIIRRILGSPLKHFVYGATNRRSMIINI
jgi:hypothetical protein